MKAVTRTADTLDGKLGLNGTKKKQGDPKVHNRWKFARFSSIEMAESQWRGRRDEFRNFLMSQECAEMAQMVANLA